MSTRDTNATTEHSRKLRQDTANRRNKEIIDDGGEWFRVIVDAEYAEKIDKLRTQLVLPAKYGTRPGNKHTKTNLLKGIIDFHYSNLNIKAQEEQSDWVQSIEDKDPE